MLKYTFESQKTTVRSLPFTKNLINRGFTQGKFISADNGMWGTNWLID